MDTYGELSAEELALLNTLAYMDKGEKDSLRGCCKREPEEKDKGRVYMKKFFVLALVVLLALPSLSACALHAKDANEKDKGEYDMKYSLQDIPTERHLEIADDLGSTQEQLDAMKQGWTSYTEYAHVVYAEFLLDYLEERYGESFKAKYMQIPQLFMDEYKLTAQVLTGPLEGKSVSAELVWKDIEEPYRTDSYISLLRGDEHKEYLRSLVREVYGGTAGSVGVFEVDEMSSDYEESIDPFAPIEELAKEVDGIINIFFPPECELTEEEYYRLFNEFIELCKEKAPRVGFTVAFITELDESREYKRFSVEQAWESFLNSTDEHSTYKWSERASSAKSWEELNSAETKTEDS